ncbi:MAG: IS200/IS605 family transposase [Bacteroidetes bacterium]|nr:IS200/IS605 family transposase [Bacteroidota bacterium]
MEFTYSQIQIHVVFAVRFRQPLISPDWEERLHKYITGVIQNRGQKVLAIGGMPDHLHVLIGMRPNYLISDLVREIKKSSSKFIKENYSTKSPFYWQRGFGAFSVSSKSTSVVIRYILNQKTHHKDNSSKAEFKNLLDEHLIDYDLEKLPD